MDHDQGGPSIRQAVSLCSISNRFRAPADLSLTIVASFGARFSKRARLRATRFDFSALQVSERIIRRAKTVVSQPMLSSLRISRILQPREKARRQSSASGLLCAFELRRSLKLIRFGKEVNSARNKDEELRASRTCRERVGELGDLLLCFLVSPRLNGNSSRYWWTMLRHGLMLHSPAFILLAVTNALILLWSLNAEPPSTARRQAGGDLEDLDAFTSSPLDGGLLHGHVNALEKVRKVARPFSSVSRWGDSLFPSHQHEADLSRTQSCETCVLTPESPLCEYGLDNIHLSRAYQGSGHRVRKMLEKALRGEVIKVG